MLSSAVSAALAFGGVIEVAQLTPQEQAVWQKIQPSIVTLMHDNSPQGGAALIDPSGLFIAHKASVSADRMLGKLVDGNTVSLRVIGQDGPSQLVLLQASPWLHPGTKAISPPMSDPKPGVALIAVLSTGPIRAEFVSANRMGVVQPYRRVLPLSEVKFEAPAEAVGGALLFTSHGEFIGALSATLGSNQQPRGNSLLQSVQDFVNQGKARNNDPALRALNTQTFGPAKLTVGYSVGADVLRRVFDGFQSPTRQVVHPTLGVFCTDAIGGGALVQEVTKGSGADLAGIKAGDILQDIGGNLIRTQIDFARVMFRQKPGETIPIRLKRGNVVMLVDAVVGQTKLD